MKIKINNAFIYIYIFYFILLLPYLNNIHLDTLNNYLSQYIKCIQLDKFRKYYHLYIKSLDIYIMSQLIFEITIIMILFSNHYLFKFHILILNFYIIQMVNSIQYSLVLMYKFHIQYRKEYNLQ